MKLCRDRRPGLQLILTSFCSGVCALQTVLELTDALTDVIAGAALAEEADDRVGYSSRSSCHFVSTLLFDVEDEEEFVM